jgi:branched-chain amino acid aminotransferase
VNGRIVPESEARVSIVDRGFILGDAVFDTTRTFGHKIFRLDEHLERLFDSLRYTRIDPGMSRNQLAELTMQVLEANLPLLEKEDDYWVTQRVTRGTPNGEGEFDPTVIVDCQPLPFLERSRYYRDGLPVRTPSVRRTPPESMSPRAKTHNYLNLVMGDLEVKAADPQALSILLDLDGNLCEGMGSNIFLVRDGELATPRDRFVLAGISRSVTFELARSLNLPVHQMDIDLFDAYAAEEVFVTSTSFCICPISTINGAVLGAGDVPGPVTDRLQRAYSGLVGIDVVQQYLARLTEPSTQ